MAEILPVLLARARRAIAGAEAPGAGVLDEQERDRRIAALMRVVVAKAALERRLVEDRSQLTGRLFVDLQPELDARLERELTFAEGEAEPSALAYGQLAPQEIGALFEGLLAAPRRKQSGSFYTPPALTQIVAQRAIAALGSDVGRREAPAVCDPALGAGAFLLAAADALATKLVDIGEFTGEGALARARRQVALHCLYGVDLNPLAVAVAEAALWLFVGDPSLTAAQIGGRLRRGDALIGEPEAPTAISDVEARRPIGLPAFHWPREFPEVFARGGFDLVIGNPPWVAYAGRAAQPLAPERKAYYSTKYAALRGYPTLHGLFVERATELAPRGVIALVVPSPIADLDGYRAVRCAVARAHALAEPLLEFGQDAFAEVTQPCFALVATPRTAESAPHGPPDRTWVLSERQRLAGTAAEIAVPKALRELAQGPSLPPELFGEMGFQTNRLVSERLLCRTSQPPEPFSYPLLEGRDVSEFRQGPPRLFLNPDPMILKQAGCRLRPRDSYRAVKFVVRQTAKVTIAALHSDLPFRNTLLAGFEVEGFTPELCVGLLNSALYRAYHLSLRRDARQAVFPQVKIGHLRALPRPPDDPGARARVAELALRATERGIDGELRAALDTAVFDLFGSTPADRREITEFLRARAPELGHSTPC